MSWKEKKMKKWHVEFRIRKGEKFGFNAEYETIIFEVEGDYYQVENFISQKKKTIKNYIGISIQRID